jgi:ribonuclease HII
MTLKLDQQYSNQGYKAIVGTDEAGRGPLAGPVVAASVMLPQDFYHPDINDSKKLSPSQRLRLYDVIIKHALAYEIVVIDVLTIDTINILEASRLAMTRCVQAIRLKYDLVLTDAMLLPNITNVDVKAIIRGDAQSLTIASASILAKVTRDRIMEALDLTYPQYGLKQHKGYPTAMHVQALKDHGPIRGLHRESFAPVKKLIKSQR